MKPRFGVLMVALALTACGKTPPTAPPEEPPAPPPPPPVEQVTVVLAGAGNIAKCTNDRDEATAQLLDAAADWVAALGDNVWDDGTLADYNSCYGPTWGRHKDRTFAVLGNHEYDLGTADGTFDYFADRAGPRPLGYYSQDIGDWHVIVINSNNSYVPVAAGSPQDQWLVSDLAANTKPCVLAMWHEPVFTSGQPGEGMVRTSLRILWERLYAAGADIVLNGQQHHYERMAPMSPDGSRDDARGIRQFNVGTGGESLLAPTVIYPNSEAYGVAFGVLKLTLRTGGYDWAFLPIPGETYADAGSAACH